MQNAAEPSSAAPTTLFSGYRRALLAAVVGAAACAAAVAQEFPNRVISFKSAMAAGSTTDVLARELAKSLQERVKQPVIVEVVAGSGGLIAAQRVLGSPADGHTLLFSSNSIISNQAMRKNPTMDMRKDMVMVSTVLEGYFGLFVSAELPVRTLPEFIAYTKAHPGKVNYGSSGVGGIVHLVTEDFRMRAGLDMVHVPFKGTAEMVPELLSNRVHATFADTTIMQPHVDSGKLRLLAVTSKKRLRQLPNSPTFEESGFPGYIPTFWYGLYAPRGTPAAAVERLNAEMKALLTPAPLQQQFAERGYQAIWLPVAEGNQKVVDEVTLMNKTIEASKIERE